MMRVNVALEQYYHSEHKNNEILILIFFECLKIELTPS